MIFLGILCFVLLILLGASLFYLIRFARIIMILEDDFSDAIEAFEETEKSFEKILEMRLFFDSREVQMVVQEVMSEIRANKVAINRIAMRFVERSKQKYTVVVEEEPDIKEIQERIMRERLLRGDMLDEGPKEILR